MVYGLPPPGLYLRLQRSDSTLLRFLPAFAFYLVIMGCSGCLQVTPVRENNYESKSAPASCISATDLRIPSPCVRMVHPFQGGSPASTPTQGEHKDSVGWRVRASRKRGIICPNEASAQTGPALSMIRSDRYSCVASGAGSKSRQC